MSLEGAKLICLNEDGHPIQTIIAKGRKFTIGYYMNCDYVLSDAKAEGVHCEIKCDAFGRVFICNLSTNNPITLNDNIVDVTRPLMHGSKLNILEKNFLWHFPRTTSSECEQLTINEPNCTPIRHIDRPKQPPISCPEIKMYREVYKRLTIHTFAHCIKSDEMGNTSFKLESQNAEKDAEEEEDEENKSVDTQPVPENVITPKAHLINSTKNKQNLSTEKKKQLLKLCHPSDMLITSYSPRETGVRIHKTFTSLVKPKVLVTKEHKKLGTPKIKYINDGDQSKNLMSFNTPSSTAVKSAINTPLTVSQSDNNSSMHLIDLTITPQKIQTAKSAIKSSTKKKLIQDHTTIEVKSLGLSAIPDSPVCDEGSKISNASNSIISISSTDSSSLISNASTRGQSPTKVQDKNFKINTPKQAPSSLRKRALLSSVKKQATTQCTTPAWKNSPNRLQMRQNIATTPKSLTVTPKDAKLPFRRSTSTPTRKIINKDRFDFTKASPSTSSAVKASPYNRFAATSTPYAVKAGSSKQQKSPIHRVIRKSLKATPTPSRISKSQIASQFREFSSLKEKSPQAVLSKRLIKRARKSLSERSSTSNVSVKLHEETDNQLNCTEDGSNELSRTFVVESVENDVNAVEQKPRDVTFSPNKRHSENIACAPDTNTNESDIVEQDECFDEIIEATKEMISNEDNALEIHTAGQEKHDVTPKLISKTETISAVNLTNPATNLKNSEILQNQENKVTAKLDNQTIFGEESTSETSTMATSVMEKNLEIVSTEESKNMHKLDDNQVFGSELTTEENNRMVSAANVKADKTNISHDDVNQCAIETCSLHFNVQELDEIEDILQPTTDRDGGSTENEFNIQNENVQVGEKAEEEPTSIKKVNVKPEDGSRAKQNEENPIIKISEKDIEEEIEEKEVKVDWQEEEEEATKYFSQESHEKEDKFKTKKSFQTNEIITRSKEQTVEGGAKLIKAELCGKKNTSQNVTMDTKLENKMSTIKLTVAEQKSESDVNLTHTATKKTVFALKYEQKQEELKENPKANVEESPTDEIKAVGDDKCHTEIEDTSKLLKEIEILLNKSDEMEQKRLEDNNGCHLTEENEQLLLESQESDKAQQSSTAEHKSAREVLHVEDQAKVGEPMKEEDVEAKKEPEEGPISEQSIKELQIPEEKSITERKVPKETPEETSISEQMREEKSMKGSAPLKQKSEETPTSDYEVEDGQHSNSNDKNNSDDLKCNKEFENLETIDDSAVDFSNEVKDNSVNNEENENLHESKMQSKRMETFSLDVTAKKYLDEEGKAKTEDNRNNTNVVAKGTTPPLPIGNDKKQDELKTSTMESLIEPECIATQVEKVGHYSVGEEEKLLGKADEIEFHQAATKNKVNPSSAILGLTTSTPMRQKSAENNPLTGSKQASSSKGIKSCNFVTTLGDASPLTLRRSARRASASADCCDVRTSTQKVKRRASDTVSVNTPSKNTSDPYASKTPSKRLDFSEMDDGMMGTINEENVENEDVMEEPTISSNTPTSAETKLEQDVWNTDDNKSVNNVSNINTQTSGASVLKEQLLSATPRRRSRRTSVSADFCYVCTPTTKVTRRSSFTESIHTTPKPSKILSGNVKDTKTPNNGSNAAATPEPYTPITPRRSARRVSASAESCSAYTSEHKISLRSLFTVSVETPTKGSHIKDLPKISRTQTPSKRLDFSVMREIDEDMGAIIEEENENQEASQEQSSPAKVPAQTDFLSHTLNTEDVVTLEGKDEALAETHFSEMVENKPTTSESNVILNVEDEPVEENVIITEYIENSVGDDFNEKGTTQPVVTEDVVVEEDSICEVVNETVAVLKETCKKPSEEDTDNLVNQEMDEIAEELEHSVNEFDNNDVPVEDTQTLLTNNKAEVWDECEYEYGQEIQDNPNFESDKLNFTTKQAVQSSDTIEKDSTPISLEDVKECQINTEKDFELPTTSKQARIKDRLELEMLETPSSCKSNLDDDAQELLQTPKRHNMPIIDTPAENVKVKNENLDKYLKTPRAKNIMMPIIEKGIDVKILPTPTPTTEYNLNITNDTESIGFEELFKTPGISRLIEPNITSTPCVEVKENIKEDKKIIKHSTNDNEISAEDEEEVLKLNKSAEEAFDELMGESMHFKSQLRKTYDRKMSSLTTSIVPSPFSAAQVVSDLPKSDVEEWIESLETEEDSVMMSNDYKQDREDETEELVDVVDSTNKSTIEPPASCLKIYFKDNTGVMNTTSSSDVIINLTLPEESSVKDPLRDSLISNRNKKPKQYSTNANATADISGLQLLDQTEESIFEAPLMVSDDDDESEADKNQIIKPINSSLKATKLIESIHDSNENSNDLAEPLVVSESEDLNLSQSVEDIEALPLEEHKSNSEDSGSLTFIDNDSESNNKMEVSSNTVKTNERQTLENEKDLITDDLNININKEQTGNVSLSNPGEVSDSEKANVPAAVTTILSKDEQEIEAGEKNSTPERDTVSNEEHVDTCGTDQSDDVSIVETGTSDATDEKSFKRQINVKERNSHLEYKKSPSVVHENIQTEQSSHPTATLHDTATTGSDIYETVEHSNADHLTQEKITVEDIAINMVSKSPEAGQIEKNKIWTNEICKPSEFSEQEVVKEENKEEMAEEFKLEKSMNQEDKHKVEFVDEKHMLHKAVTPHKTEETVVLDIREHATPSGTNTTQPEETQTQDNVSTSVNEENITEANFIIQERHKSSVAEENIKASNIICEPVDYSKAVLSVEEEKTNVQNTCQEEVEKEKSIHNQRNTNDIYKVQQIEGLQVEATTGEVYEAINLSSRKTENKIEEKVTNLKKTNEPTNESFNELKPSGEVVKCRRTESLKAGTENVEIIVSLEVYEKHERKDTSPAIGESHTNKETIESGEDMSANSEEASTSIKQTVTKQSFCNQSTTTEEVKESMQKKIDMNIRSCIKRSDAESESQTIVKENEKTDNNDVVYVEQKDQITENPGTGLATTNDRTEKPLSSGADNIITISDEEIEAITAEAHVTNEVCSPAAEQQTTDLPTETKESPENYTTTPKTYIFEITISDSTKSTSESSTSHIDDNREQSKVRTRKTTKAFQVSEDSNSNIDIPLTRRGRKRLQQNVLSVEASKSQTAVKRTRRNIAKSESSQDSIQDKEDKEAGTTKRSLRKKLTKKSPLKTIEEHEAAQKVTSPEVNEPHITPIDLSNIKTVQGMVVESSVIPSEDETKMLTSELPQDLSNPLNLVTHKSEILHNPPKQASHYIPTVLKEESPSSSHTTRQLSNSSIQQQIGKKEPINLTILQATVNSHQESESRQQEEQKPLKKRARQLHDQNQGSLESKPNVIIQTTITFQGPVHDLEDVMKTKDPPTSTKTKLIAADTSSINIAPPQHLNSESIEPKENVQLSSAPVVLNNSTPPDNSLNRSDEQIAEGSSKRARGTRKRILHKTAVDTEKPRRGTRRKQNLIDQTIVTEPNELQTSENQKLEELNQPEPQMSPVKSSRGRRKRAKQVDNDNNSSVTASTSKRRTNRRKAEERILHEQEMKEVIQKLEKLEPTSGESEKDVNKSDVGSERVPQEKEPPPISVQIYNKKELFPEHANAIQTPTDPPPPANISVMENREELQIIDKKKPLKKKGRKRKDDSGDTLDANASQDEPSRKRAAQGVENQGHNVEVLPKLTDGLEGTPLNAERTADQPVSQSKRPQRKAATAYHNYDETSDSEMAPAKKNPDTHRKRIDVEKSPVPAAIDSSLQLSPTEAGIVTARGRMRKPNARVQQFLEEERAKGDTPKKRTASSTPQRTPGGRARKASTADSLTTDNVQETPKVAKRGQGRILEQLEHQPIEEVEKPPSVAIAQPEDKDITTLAMITEVVKESVKSDEIVHTPAITKPRRGRKAKILNATEEPTQKKSPGALQMEKLELTTASASTPTRIAGRRTAAAAAKARIEEDAIAAAAIDPPKKVRSRKVAAKVTPIENDEPNKLQNTVTVIEPPKMMDHSAASTENLAADLVIAANEPEAMEITHPTKRGARKAAAVTETVVPPKRGRRAKAAVVDYGEHATDDTEVKTRTIRNRKIVHFESPGQNAEQSEETPSGTVGSSISTETAQSKVTILTEEANVQQTQTTATKRVTRARRK